MMMMMMMTMMMMMMMMMMKMMMTTMMMMTKKIGELTLQGCRLCQNSEQHEKTRKTTENVTG